MTTSLAPRPANEERRAKAVIQTGLIDNPKPELFQVYCDLAKDITDFDTATFSLFDNDFQCGMASAGRDDRPILRQNATPQRLSYPHPECTAQQT